MNLKIDISATIVLYNENEEILQKTISSFLKTPLSKKLFLIDNSPTNKLKVISNHPEIEYIHNPKNIGFGKAHNQILKKIKETSNYHLILNPDVFFDENTIPNLIAKLNKDKQSMMIVPKVEFPNGKSQFIYRKFPTFFDLIIRRLGIFKSRIKTQEYQNLDLSKQFYPEAVHGCFMLFNTNDFIALKGFDERYFLYLEDIDLCKKINKQGKHILYYPSEKIIHIHKKGSSKSFKLFFHHVNSAIKYFLKW